MKNIKIIIYFFLFIHYSYGQKNTELNIYYDAVDLKNGEKVSEILSKYNVKDSTNLYLKDLYNKNKDTKSGPSALSNEKLLNKIGNFEITPIADGLAQFIASRVKKELSIAFFDKFKKEITLKDYKDLQILFPKTNDLLQLIDTEIYDFQPYLSGIQQNAKTDFKMLPKMLPRLLKDSETKLSKVVEGKPTSKYILGQCFNLIDSLNSRRNIGATLENLNTELYFTENEMVPALRKSIDLARLFSLALRDSTVSETTYYIKADKIAELAKDPVLLRNMIGLAIAASRLGGSVGKFDNTIYNTLNDSKYANNITVFKDIILGFKDANQYFEDAKKEKAEAKINTYLLGVNKIFETGKLITEKLNIITPATDTIFIYLNKSVDLIGSLYQKKYSTAILQTLDFYKSIADNSKSLINTKIYKYGTFLAQIAELEKSEDVVKVLEQYAAPVGSYRDKSIYKFTVSLDSFTGFGYGLNKIENDGKRNNFALSTPIGVSFSFSNEKGNGSFTIMPTLFDIGPLVSYRFFNGKGEVPSIYLKEIFAPGIFASVGFNSKIPVFLNVGYQKPAYIKTIDEKNKIYNLEPYKLLSANIAVNIPLFKLFTR